jgi:hypothetical protein
LAEFQDLGWEQEDDMMVTLQRSRALGIRLLVDPSIRLKGNSKKIVGKCCWFDRQPAGNERIAMGQVTEAVEGLHLSDRRLINSRPPQKQQ